MNYFGTDSACVACIELTRRVRELEQQVGALMVDYEHRCYASQIEPEPPNPPQAGAERKGE